MSGEKIQVREGWWRQRCGNVVRVERARWPYKFLWRCADDNYFCEDGKWSTGADHQRDLVEYLGKNITIMSADIDIPELRVPVLFWVCPDCPDATVMWHPGASTPERAIATCDNCGRTSAD